MDIIYKSLVEIVGGEYVTKEPEELFIYSRDTGTSEPHFPDCVVMPKTTEEVQTIVKLANENKIPVVPLGGGLNLNGLTIPLQGGIVVDMKRMDRILEINEKSRYAVIEAGVSEGKLKAYLERNYPDLWHSMPDAPPAASVIANALTHGQGHLAQVCGFHSGMLNGLEVVLPTGEVCKIGTCSVSPFWFSGGAPLPDLTGLFAGWFGTTGIVTKAAFKLYPKPKLRDVEVFVTESLDHIPDMVLKITDPGVADDIQFGTKKPPGMPRGPFMIAIWITANSDSEMEFKKKLMKEALREYVQSGQGEFISLATDEQLAMLEIPMRSDTAGADVLKGGGYQETDTIMPLDKFPEACRGMFEIASKYNLDFYSMGGRCLDRAHRMMCCWSYRFNRGDPQNIEATKKALRTSTELAVKLDGLLWRPGVYGQKLMIEKMNPNTLKLMMKIKELMDPNHIMNPGNWEVP